MGLTDLDQLIKQLDSSTSLDQSRRSLEKTGVPKAANQAFKHIVAGHGEIYTSVEQAKRVIFYTTRHLECYTTTHSLLVLEEGLELLPC